MVKKYLLTLLLITGTLLTLLSPSVLAQGVAVVYPGGEKVQTITSTIKKADERVTKVNEYITKQKETLVQGYESAMKPINDAVSDAQKYVGDQVDSATDYIGDQASQVGDKVAGAFSSSDSGDQAGSGFSLSKTASSVKGAYTEYGKYVSPALGLATGNLNLEDIATIKDTLFIDNSNDQITADEVAKVRANLKEFIYESSKTTLADATQIMNGSTQFGKTKEAAGKKAKESTNIKEDIDTASGADIAMNVMTNVLLSMDITTLGVRSGAVYQEMNNLKNTNPSQGLGGLGAGLGIGGM